MLPTNATSTEIIWKTSDESALQSLGNGQFKAKKLGKTRIIAEAADGSGVSAQVEINVLPLLIQTIALKKAEYAPTVGDQFELTAEITPENATNPELLWWVSDQNVLENLGNGAFRALKVGNAVVEVRTTDGSQRKASCKITVVYPDGIATAGTNSGTPRVTVEGNTLVIAGISAQTWVEVGNLRGQSLHRAQSKGDVIRIALREMPQVLIVKVENRSYKVVITLH